MNVKATGVRIVAKRFHFNEGSHNQSVIESNKRYNEFIDSLVEEIVADQLSKEKGVRATKELVSQWIADNPDKVENIKNEYRSSMAFLRYNDIQELRSTARSTTLLASVTEPPRPKTKTTPMAMDKVYKKIDQDFFNEINRITKEGTQKVQTGSKLIANAIDLDRKLLYQHTGKTLKTTPEQLSTAYQNIRKTGRFMAFDFETLGGKDLSGQNVIDSITEFAFGNVDAVTGQVDDFSVSAIGIKKGSELYKKLEGIIEDIETKGYISERHRIIGTRLLKMGHEKTTYQSVAGKPGLIEFTSFAGDEDITTISADMMRKGLERYADIYDVQAANKVTYKGRQIFEWEKELLETLDEIKSKNITTFGFNSTIFDVPALKQLLNSGQFSSEAREIANELGLSTHQWENNHMDLLAALRSSALSENWMELYTPEERQQILKARGLTHFQQESLVRKFFPTFYEEKTAHVAKTDIEALAQLGSQAAKIPGSDTSLIQRAMDTINIGEISSPLKAGRQQLFYARNSIGMNNLDKSGVMSFVEDAFTGELRTFGGMAIKDGNVTQELFGQYGVQRGVSYTIDSIFGFEMKDEWLETIKDTHPGLMRKDLIAVRMLPVTSETIENNFKSISPTVLVGTPEEVMSEINRSLILTGEMGAKGYRALPGELGKKVEEVMGSFKFNKDGSVEYIGHSIEEQIKESTFRLQNEAGARARRSLSVKKEKGMLAMLEDMQKEAERRGLDYNAETRKKFLEEIIHKSAVMADGVAKRNLNIPSGSLLKTFQDYHGWKHKGQPRIYRETIDAVIASTEYSESIKHVTKAFLDAAKERAGDDVNAQEFYLRQYFETLYSKLQEQGIDLNTAVGNKEFAVRKMDLNKFDIDLSGLPGMPKVKTPSILDQSEGILTVNLESSNLDLADRIREMRGLKPLQSDIEKVKELKVLGEHIGFTDIDLEKDSVEVATNKIVTHLKDIRRDNFAEGRIKSPVRMDILSHTPVAETATELIGETIAQANKVVPEYIPLDKGHANIVTEMLFTDVTKADLLKNGYTPEQAEILMHFREIRKKDTRKFMEDFFEGIKKSGGGLLVDKESKDLFLLADGQQIKLENIPRDIFEDGRFYTQIGGNRVVPAVGFYTNRAGEIELKSLIGKAHDSSYGMAQWRFPKAAQQGQDKFVEAVESHLKNFGKIIREAPSVDRGDAQDVRAAFNFSVKDVIEELHELNRKGVFDDVVFTDDEKMRRIVSKELTSGRVPFHDEKLLRDNMNTILEAVAKRMGDETAIRYARRFGFENKNTADYLGTLDPMHSLIGGLSPDVRGVEFQTSRTAIFNEALVREKIKTNKYLQDISIGKPLYGAREYVDSRKVLSGTSNVVNSHITAKSLNMRSEDLRALINEADLPSDVKDALSMLHLEEGAAVGNPEILNEIFRARNAIQKINIRKTYDMDLENIEEIRMRKNLAPKIVIEPDGKISFSYSSGTFIEHGDRFLTTKGIQGKAGEVLSGKYDGVLKIRVFTKTQGAIVNEMDVQSTLNAHRERILAASDPIREAINVLEQTYDIAYQLNPLDAGVHRKIAEMGVEKNTVTYLAAGLGDSGDKTILAGLEALGLSGRKGMVLNQDFLEALDAEDIASTDLGALIAHDLGRKLTHDEIVERLHDATGLSPAEFKTAIKDEQMMLWDSLLDVFRQKGILKEGEMLHYITDNREAFMKHKDAVVYVEEVATRLREAVEDPEKALKIFKEAVPKARLSETGEFIIPSDAKVSVEALKGIVKEYGLQPEILQVTTKAGDTIDYELLRRSYLHMTSHYDLGPSSFSTDPTNKMMKPMKLSTRGITMMSMDAYDAPALQRILDDGTFMDKETFDRVFGHAIDYDDAGQIVVRSDYRGKPILGSVIRALESNRYERFGVSPDDALVIEGGELVTSDFLTNRLGELEAKGVNLTPIIERLQNEGYTNVSLSAVEDIHSAAASEIARHWNAGKITNMEDLQKLGFGDPVKLLDVNLSAGMNQGFIDSGYERSMLIDLHIDVLGDNQIYTTEQGRYLAVPFQPQKYFSDEEARTELRSKVSQLQSAGRRVIEQINQGEMGISPELTAHAVQDMRDIVEKIQEEIATGQAGKKRSLASISTIYLTDSARYTASGHQLYGNETSQFLTNLEFDGINLVEAAGQGKEYDYAFVGRDHFRQYFDPKYLERVGMTEEQMERHLKTKGALQLVTREPADYKRSTSFAIVYLSDHVKGDKAIFSAAMVEAKGGDFDGDQFSIASFKAPARIKDSTGKWQKQNIDYTTYQFLLDQGKEIELEDPHVFDDAIASMHYNAYENRVYSVLNKERKEVRKALNSSIAEMYAVDGVLWPKVTEEYSAEEVREKMQQHMRINEILSERTNIPVEKLITTKKAEYHTEAVKYIEEITTTDAEKEALLKDFVFGVQRQNEYLERALKATKLAAGESNYFLFNLKRTLNAARQSGIDISNDEMNAAQQILLAIQENFLAGKNLADIDENILVDYRKAVGAMFGDKGRPRDPSLMKEFINTHISDRKEFGYLNMPKEEAIDLFVNIGAKFEKGSELESFLMQGITQKGFLDPSATLYTTGKDIDTLDAAVRHLRDHLEDLGVTQTIQTKHLIKEKNLGSKAYGEDIFYASKWDPPTSASLRESTETLIEKASHKLSQMNITGRDLAFGALGLAGAVMVAGFVGGNPSKPAETHAQDTQNEELYAIPSLSDQDMSVIPNQRGGYIININAHSPKGRQHAIDAIQQAVASTQTTTSVNIAMNIRDQGGNITSRNIEDLLGGAFL